MRLTTQCANNRKTSHLKFESFVRANYLKRLDPNIAKVTFKARTRMFDIKVNYQRNHIFNLGWPFCKYISSNVIRAYFIPDVFMQQN